MFFEANTKSNCFENPQLFEAGCVLNVSISFLEPKLTHFDGSCRFAPTCGNIETCEISCCVETDECYSECYFVFYIES